WRHAIYAIKPDWTGVFIASALIFPRLALGLSGFETGVSVMPLVNGAEPGKTEETIPGRVRSTRKLLLSAALIMSVMLLLSSFAASVLIPESAYRLGGPADGRAIAYLAHLYLGNVFGTVYDISTILILWFAGASAMAGLLNLIPRYLPRYGMAPEWVAYQRPLVLVLLVLDILVTLAFRASVTAQGGAYATGVLVLMLSAAVAVTVSLWQEASLHKPQNYLLSFYFLLVSVMFLYTTVTNVIERPDGAIVASIFIFLLLTASALSRILRSTEMRVSKVTFADVASAEVWQSIQGKKVNLIPVRMDSPVHRRFVSAKVREHYKVDGPLAYLFVTLMDNRSDFLSPLSLRVVREGEDVVINATGAVALANSIAYISELLDPISIVLGLTHRPLMRQSLEYLFFGEGETGLLVYSILVRYWETIKRYSGLPLILLVSESGYRQELEAADKPAAEAASG
ncbi:MAG: hypothetical protein WCC25_11390, partial [Candidatus Korobacteraceae bacterium]